MDNTLDRIRTHFFLAEAAQVSGGKLYVMGGAFCGQGAPAPGAGLMLAICGTIDVPWDQNNRMHNIQIELLEDGNNAPYMLMTPNGEQPFRIDARFQTAVPPQLPRGSSSSAPFATQFVLPVMRAGVFYFRVAVDGNETQRLAYALSIGQPPQ